LEKRSKSVKNINSISDRIPPEQKGVKPEKIIKTILMFKKRNQMLFSDVFVSMTIKYNETDGLFSIITDL